MLQLRKTHTNTHETRKQVSALNKQNTNPLQKSKLTHHHLLVLLFFLYVLFLLPTTKQQKMKLFKTKQQNRFKQKWVLRVEGNLKNKKENGKKKGVIITIKKYLKRWGLRGLVWRRWFCCGRRGLVSSGMWLVVWGVWKEETLERKSGLRKAYGKKMKKKIRILMVASVAATANATSLFSPLLLSLIRKLPFGLVLPSTQEVK